MHNIIKLSIILLLLAHSSAIQSMSKIDSLSQLVQGSNKKGNVEIKLELIAAYIDDYKIVDAEKLINEVRFVELSPIQKGELLYNEGMIYQSRYDYSNAMKMFLEATKIAATENNGKLKNAANFRIAELFFKEKDYNQTILIIEKILLDPTDDKVFLSQCHEILGDVYHKQKIFGKAKLHFKTALDLKIATKQFDGAANLASFMGNMVGELEEFDEAINYHRMSLNWHQSQDDKVAAANDNFLIAKVHNDAGEYTEALDNLRSAMRMNNSLDNPVDYAAYLALKGDVFANLNKKVEAIDALTNARIMLQSKDSSADGFNILQDISETYHKMGDDKMAFLVHKDFVKAKNINGSLKKAKELGVMKMKFESEFQAEKSKQEIDKLEILNAYNNRVRYFLFALVVMMGALIFYVSKSLSMKKKSNLLLQRRNDTIESQAKEIGLKNEKLATINNSLEELNGKLVSEISERESIEHSSFSRDKFIATMSQEMKTPLTAIVGLSNMLMESNPKEDQIENIRALQFSANDISVFVNDILDYSKIEAGKLTILKREFNLESIVDDVCMRFGSRFNEKGVNFSCEYDSKIPKTILGDDVRINQIVTNFLSFSLSDNKTTQIKTHFNLVEITEDCVDIAFDMWFDGEYISDERIQHIFRKEDYESNANGYPRRLLGVTIAKRLIDLQDGHFNIESSVDNGTKISVRLSFVLLDADRIIYSKEEQINMLKDKRILVVEDNKINQLVVANMLKKLGMAVVVADNGLEGVEAMKAEDFDLVLMDIQMPIMDGYKATSEIRKLEDVNKNQVPIIALTASAFLTETEKAQLFGMDDHVGKPFSLDDLVDKITILLMGKQQSGQ